MTTIRRIGMGAAVILATSLAAACSGSVEPKDTAGAEGGEPDLVSREMRNPEDGRGGPEEEVAGQPTEQFVIPFVYRGIVPGETIDQSDLYIIGSDGMNPLAPGVDKPVALTTFSLSPQDCQLVLARNPDGTPLSTAPCSCNLGCVVDETLTWILVTIEKPTQTGFTFQIGKFDAELKVKMVKGAEFHNIVDTAFAGGYLYFSQVKYCSEPNCQFTVYRYDLENIPQPESLFLIPPADDQDYKNGQHITDGHFAASRDGSTLAFLSPTIRSSRVYVWRKNQVKELDYICPGVFQNGECTGTGSEFSDLDPLALNADGRQLAYVSHVKNRLELRLYDTDTGKVKNSALVDTGDKDYVSTTCAQISVSDWKFNRLESLAYAADGKRLFFIASSACTPGAKPWTDIFSLPVDAAKGGLIDAAAYANLTRNWRGEGAKNTVVGEMALSPQGNAVAYLATPMFGADKATPLSDASAKAKESAEVWVIRTDGEGKKQLTYNTKYSAVWLTAVPPL